MPNGKPHDDPLLDILVHGLETYGREADDLIRKISNLSSDRELREWWEAEIGWKGNRELALQKARSRYGELLQRAKDSGWDRSEETGREGGGMSRKSTATGDDDWRLQGQENYLRGKTLRWSQYTQPSAEWDHDHCEFCGAKFAVAKLGISDSLQFGYTTEDRYRWICKKCFEDFKIRFGWQIISDSEK